MVSYRQNGKGYAISDIYSRDKEELTKANVLHDRSEYGNFTGTPKTAVHKKQLEYIY